MKLKPIGERVIIKLGESVEEKTEGGIIIPQTSQESTIIKGVVFEVGNDPKLEVKKGQVIIYDKYTGQPISYAGDNYVVLHQSDIIAVVVD